MAPDLIYLDNAATTWPKPQRVLDEMTRFHEEEAGSPNRAGHRMAMAAERVVHETRVRLAHLFNVADPHRIVHCFNCSDALNIAIKGALREGDHAITTDLDHNSVLRPLQAMADAGFIALTRVPVSAGGFIDPAAIKAAITPKTKLIATLHASNVVGTLQPVAEIGAIARARDVLFLVDAAQAVGTVDVDVEAMHIDLLAFPGHKELLGPTGTGGLYVGPRADLRPWREGGTGGDSAHPTQPEEMPTWLEAGTHNAVGLAGLNAALSELDPAAAREHDRVLIHRLLRMIEDDDRIRVVGDPSPNKRVGVVSLLIEGYAPVDVSAILDESFGICTRPGLHCAPHAHRTFGTFPDGTVRAAVGWANTEEHIDRLVDALRQIADAK